MDNEINQQILAELQKMNEMLGQRGSSSDPTAMAAQKNAKAMNESAAAAEALAEAEEEAAKAAQVFKQTMGNLMGTLGSFGKALTDTSGKISSLGDGFDSLGDTAVDLGKNFGAMGLAAGLAVKALTSVASSSLKQAEATLDAKDNLTKLGGVGIGTGKELLDMANKAKISSKNLDLLVKPMQSATGSFLGLGATVAEGQKTFIKMTAITEEQRKAFGRLGLSQGEVIQAQADYVNLQRMSGTNLRAMGKSMEDIKKASIAYTENLVELAAISGGDIESAKRAKEIANTQFAEMIKTRQENAEIARLKAAGRNAEAADLEARQKARKQLIEEMSGQFGEGTGEAIAQYFATGVVNESVAPLLRQGVDLEKQRAAFLAAGADADKQMKVRAALAEDLKRGEQRTIDNVGTAAALSKETADAFGLTSKSMAKYAETQGRDELKARQEANAAIKKQAEAGADPMADARENLRSTQRDLAVGLDALLLKVNPLTSAFGLGALAFGGLTVALGVASKALNSFTLAAGKPGAGGMVGDIAGAGGKAGKLGKLLSMGAKGAGIAAIGGIAGGALDAAGQEIGGTTGKVVSGAGTVAQYASMGAMLGPMGALAGGVIGLGKAIYDNVKATKDDTKTTDSSNELQKEFQQREQDRQARIAEQNKKLTDLLGQNNESLKLFSGQMEDMTDTKFNDLISQLEQTGKITQAQVTALREQRAAARKEVSDVTAARQQADADKLKPTEIAADKKFTTADSEALENKKLEIAAVQEEINKAKTYAEQEAAKKALAMLEQEKKILDNKKKYEEEYNKAEADRIEKEKKALDEKNKALEVLERARNQREKDAKLIRDYAYSISKGLQSIDVIPERYKKQVSAQLASNKGGGAVPGRPGSAGGSNDTISSPNGGGGGGGGASASGDTAAPGEFKSTSTPSAPLGDGAVQMGQTVKIGREVRKGGTVSWRTNNPGNVSYGGLAKKFGAIGTWKKLDGDAQQRSVGIAIMPTLEAGDNLKMALWRRPKYIDKTIDEGVAQWTGTTGLGSSYAKDLARAAGATINTVIGELTDPQLRAMVEKQKQWEGFKQGQLLQAKKGGIVSGSAEGYPATLHGNEMIVPLQGDSLLEKLGKMSAAALGQETSSGSNKMESAIQEMLAMNQKTSQEWISKLDTMIGVLENSKSTQEKTLRAVRT